MRLGATQKMVLAYLHAEYALGRQPSTTEIAQQCELTHDQAKCALQRLHERGLVLSTTTSGPVAQRWAPSPFPVGRGDPAEE